MKISIVIPVYNVSSYIERCVKSVLSQTYTNIECILVDDASPDDSIIKCERMLSSYTGAIHFVILRHEKNRGVSAARNTGLKAASGDYIFFLDSDDELSSDCITVLMKPALENPAIEMVQGNHELYFDGNSLNFKQKRQESQVGYLSSPSYVRSNFYDTKKINLYAWNKLLKKDFLYRYHLFFKEGQLWEDSLWMFYIMKHLSKAYVINQITYFYYKRPDSITTGTDRKIRCSHLIRKFDEISHNFTIGDSGREAKYFLYWVCFCLINKSTDKLSGQTLLSFKRALADDGYVKEEFCLSTVMFLSKYALGRGLCRITFWLRDSMKELLGKKVEL